MDQDDMQLGLTIFYKEMCWDEGPLLELLSAKSLAEWEEVLSKEIP